MMLCRMCELVNGEAARRCSDPDTQRIVNGAGAMAVGGLTRLATGSCAAGAAASAGVRAAAKAAPQGTASSFMGPVVFVEYMVIATIAVPVVVGYGVFKGIGALLDALDT